MCNRYANKIAFREYVEGLKKAMIELVSPTPDRAPNLEPVDNIFPTDKAPVLRAADGGVELVHLRWGLIPWFHDNKPIKDWKLLTTNARGESIIHTATFKAAFQKRR